MLTFQFGSGKHEIKHYSVDRKHYVQVFYKVMFVHFCSIKYVAHKNCKSIMYEEVAESFIDFVTKSSLRVFHTEKSFVLLKS